MEKTEFYREARSDLPGPLAGIRVLEATTTWAGPMCGCALADLGADVVKLELPEGEVLRRMPPFLPGTDPPVSFLHATVNRNKRSLTLDLRRPEGRELFLSLAARSDIVVENFRPGTMDRWGLGYAGVRAVKPDIIYVSISGFGQFGPDHDRVGYDPVTQAAGGFSSLNGTPDGPPVKAATFLSDDLAGIHGALAAAAALTHRQNTGEGQYIDVALLDSLLFQSNGYLTLGAMDVPIPRMGDEFIFAAPANSYACADGHVFVGILLDSQWKSLAPLIGRPELADHEDYATAAGRLPRRAELNEMLAAWCAKRRVDEIAELFKKESIPAAPVRTYREAARDPHVLERDLLQPTPHRGREDVPITGPPAKFSRTPTRVRHAAPELGADTDDVLAELGLPPEERRRLREAGVV